MNKLNYFPPLRVRKFCGFSRREVSSHLSVEDHDLRAIGSALFVEGIRIFLIINSHTSVLWRQINIRTISEKHVNIYNRQIDFHC